MEKIATHNLKRKLPAWAQVVKTVNHTDIYNINVLENILSWTKDIPNIPAIDYYGNVITYGELSDRVSEYVNGLKAVGIEQNDVITLCMPVSTENILTLLATNHMGLINNNPNFLFLRSNFKTYTERKGSRTLVILDSYLPFVIDEIQKCNVKNVIITNLKEYLPDSQKHIFDDMSTMPVKMQEIFCDTEKQKECAKKMGQIKNVNFIQLREVVETGRKVNKPLISEPVDILRDVSYSYTSGTTGNPKCIVYKEESANALIELHKGVNTKDYVGERVFQIIPLTHATGERFCGYLQMARGKTLVPQPIYNKDAFGAELMKSRCNWVTAAPSFYLAGVAQGLIAPNAFEYVTRPSSGGEPVTKSNVKLIDEWLKMNGCRVRFSIGGGAAEDGSSTICSYFMDEETKTNETGHPVEPGIIAKIVDESGNELEQGKRGFLHVSSAAAADRYLDDELATRARWYYDENGVRWGVTGDIAVKNKDGSYSILGRASDSCTDKNGNKVYLFDIEYSLEATDPVIEWEISAHSDKSGNNYIVGQVVEKQEYKGREDEVIEYMLKKYKLDAIKIYAMFESSEVTGKRDIQKLKEDKDDYFGLCDDEYFYKISYPADFEPQKEKIRKESVRNQI